MPQKSKTPKKRKTTPYSALCNELRVTQGALAALVDELQVNTREHQLLTHAVELLTQSHHTLRLDMAAFYNAIQKFTDSLPLPVQVSVTCPNCATAYHDPYNPLESDDPHDYIPPVPDDAEVLPGPRPVHYHAA